MKKIFEIKYETHLESSRRLPNLPSTHPCARLHGHSFKVTLCLRGSLVPRLDWVIDYHEISTKTSEFFKTLDHVYLNEVPGLENPTTENLCSYIYENLKKTFPELHQITIRETHNTECTYPVIYD